MQTSFWIIIIIQLSCVTNFINFLRGDSCKTVRPMLSDRCPVYLSLCLVCDFGVLWPNGWTDQDGTWHAGRPWPWPHCGDPAPQKGTQPPIFGPCPLWPNGWMDQDATWYGGRPRSRRLCVIDGDPARSWMHQDTTWYWGTPRPMRHCVRWGPSPPKRGTRPLQFMAHVYAGQTTEWIKIPLGMEVCLGPGDVVLDGPSSPNKK